MNFLDLHDFIQNKMRMLHIYQPLMLITLLEHGGKASVRDIASSICSHDESQLDYYELITKNMVGNVLRNRNVVIKEKDAFGLPGVLTLHLCQPTTLSPTIAAKRRSMLHFHRQKNSPSGMLF